ncbi:hypothetical protein BDN72DRAFT_845610 [Pluteus cervinus]|uniref:Uncharacterized protein n=1 Tax=Pluteus cervinus TaxID=181527 RepID=A0ACD3AHZ2_9AGAR|nr:hypothetical protein BDN72DRAFT_845610 [Pluteus cervinus]
MTVKGTGRALREYLELEIASTTGNQVGEWEKLSEKINILVREQSDVSESAVSASFQLEKVYQLREQIIRAYPHLFTKEKEVIGGKFLRQHIMNQINTFRWTNKVKLKDKPVEGQCSTTAHGPTHTNTKAPQRPDPNARARQTRLCTPQNRRAGTPSRPVLGSRTVRAVDPMIRTASSTQNEEGRYRVPRRLTSYRLVPFIELPLRIPPRGSSQRHQSILHSGPQDDLKRFLRGGCQRPLTNLYPCLQRYGCKTMNDIHLMADWPLTMIRAVVKDVMKCTRGAELRDIDEMDWDILAYGIWRLGRMAE